MVMMKMMVTLMLLLPQQRGILVRQIKYDLLDYNPETFVIPSLRVCCTGIHYIHKYAKGSLPHTSDSMHLEDHNLVLKRHTSLMFYAFIHLLFCTKFHVNGSFQSDVINH